MLKNISNLGRALSKKEQQSILGGGFYEYPTCDCNLSYDFLEDPGCDEYNVC